MKIAFVKYAGVAAGGTEKYLQTIALLLKKEGHEVDYYYTNVARLIGRNWQHPPNDAHRKKILDEAGIKTVECYVDYKVCGQTPEVWHGTDFFEKFDESEYDIIVSGRQGQPEYPFTEIKNTKIVDTIHGTWASGTHQSNIKKCILISQEQRQKWLSNGGDDNKCVVIPKNTPPTSEKKTIYHMMLLFMVYTKEMIRVYFLRFLWSVLVVLKMKIHTWSSLVVVLLIETM